MVSLLISEHDVPQVNLCPKRRKSRKRKSVANLLGFWRVFAVEFREASLQGIHRFLAEKVEADLRQCELAGAFVRVRSHPDPPHAPSSLIPLFFDLPIASLADRAWSDRIGKPP